MQEIGNCRTTRSGLVIEYRLQKARKGVARTRRERTAIVCKLSHEHMATLSLFPQAGMLSPPLVRRTALCLRSTRLCTERVRGPVEAMLANDLAFTRTPWPDRECDAQECTAKIATHRNKPMLLEARPWRMLFLMMEEVCRILEKCQIPVCFQLCVMAPCPILVRAHPL